MKICLLCVSLLFIIFFYFCTESYNSIPDTIHDYQFIGFRFAIRFTIWQLL